MPPNLPNDFWAPPSERDDLYRGTVGLLFGGCVHRAHYFSGKAQLKRDGRQHNSILTGRQKGEKRREGKMQKGEKKKSVGVSGVSWQQLVSFSDSSQERPASTALREG